MCDIEFETGNKGWNMYKYIVIIFKLTKESFEVIFKEFVHN